MSIFVGGSATPALAHSQSTVESYREESKMIEVIKRDSSAVPIYSLGGDANTTVESIVREFFKDDPVMIAVAWCESHFTHNNKDGSVLRGRAVSADVGVMQINEFYHKKTATDLGLDLHNLADNLSYAYHLYQKEGTRPWNASRHCWEKKKLTLSQRP